MGKEISLSKVLGKISYYVSGFMFFFFCSYVILDYFVINRDILAFFMYLNKYCISISIILQGLVVIISILDMIFLKKLLFIRLLVAILQLILAVLIAIPVFSIDYISIY